MTTFKQAFPGMKRVRQITSAHCGPAVLAALFSFVGIKVSQTAITKSLKAQKSIRKHGLNVLQMAKAAKIYSQKGEFVFWQKPKATTSDLNRIVNVYKFPVGVEWQGVFDWPDEEDDDNSRYGNFEDEDQGHYSVVTAINMAKESLLISDPERHYAGLDRKFKINDFKKRWWDTNLIKGRPVRDDKMMFVITPKGVDFPKKLGMIKG